ncbi:Protein kinase domain/Protein tyrosine kinase, putative [Angomonas deanei]|uniref:Protein kinase domain/Protein tyrosine kinase, putative n=1 Tax=Angomonas deanei TaxID=59799 RepID=A0A7G2C671_9TRYP|nr:Protein kinase domain/Protein tyrosine kinase, putative [Angomonas deanei]
MKLHTTFQTDHRVYLLLDYLNGGELLFHTQRAPEKHFSESVARFFIAELAIAVEYLRKRGIVHRDIKGENLVLDAEGHVVLSDFGFAKKIISDEEDVILENSCSLQHAAVSNNNNNVNNVNNTTSTTEDSGYDTEEDFSQHYRSKHYHDKNKNNNNNKESNDILNDESDYVNIYNKDIAYNNYINLLLHADEKKNVQINSFLKQRLIKQHTGCGTIAYIAPELLTICKDRDLFSSDILAELNALPGTNLEYESGGGGAHQRLIKTVERNRRSGYGFEADWWCVGVVLYTLLTGYFPFLKSKNADTCAAIVKSPLQFPQHVKCSDETKDLLQQLLQKKPSARISTLDQLKAHPFFNGFDWVKCERRELTPPLLLHKHNYNEPNSGAKATKELRQHVVFAIEQHRRSILGKRKIMLENNNNNANISLQEAKKAYMLQQYKQLRLLPPAVCTETLHSNSIVCEGCYAKVVEGAAPPSKTSSPKNKNKNTNNNKQ